MAARAQQVPAGQPTVTGAQTAEPKVTVPKGYKAPAKPGAPVVVIKGAGQAAREEQHAADAVRDL